MRPRTMLFLSTTTLLLIASLLYVFPAVPVARAATLPANFSESVVTGIASPTALAFTPDGRLLITTQGGQLRVYQNGSLLGTPALDLSSRLCINSERGLLGIAVHPNFGSNGYIYLFYTFNKNNDCTTRIDNGAVNRVSRFTMSSNTVNASSELVLIDNISSYAGNHNAGDLHFGKDGLLYISVGDAGCDYAGSGCAGSNDAAREQHTLLGKILRITDSGGIPSGNPYLGSDSARCNTTGRTDPGKKCQETFAWGLRNPFRIAFDPNASTTRFFINDVGQNAWEEIDEGRAGADYGWNDREGFCANGSTSGCRSTPNAVVNGQTDPIHAYGRDIGYSITGGAFVPNGAWGSSYDGDYLFGDYGGKIMRLEPNGSGGYNRSDFVTGLGSSSVVAMIFGPHNGGKSLFFTTYNNGGQVRRIDFTGTANRAPTAAIAASPTSGAAPLAVNFNGSNSSDPDGDALTYIWNFGDGSAVRETSTATTSYTYNAIGTYNASLTVRDSRGATSTAVQQRIDVGNTAPTPRIIAPTADKLFRVGETITLQGSATDAQDGTLADSRLSWRVIQHHADHTHPFLPPTTGNNITITAPAPEDLLAATNSYLAIELTATDGQGLSTTIRQLIQPRKVEITFDTQPTGLKTEVNGTTLTGRSPITSWEAYRLNVNAPNQSSGGTSYTFKSWSDGGAQAHTITTPATATTYTASYNSSPAGQSVVYLTLINADTDQPIAGFDPLPNNAVLNFAALPTRNLSIRATTNPSTVGSVRFAYDGNQNYKIENATPYAIAGDQNRTDYNPWTPAVGYHTLTVTPYSAASATGTAGTPLTIDFTVIESAGSGVGLRGEYFDRADFTNARTVRTDATVNFDWGTTIPAGTTLGGENTFSVRWTGQVEAPIGGTYTFTTTSDDGVRLWVCGTQIINNWTDHAPTDNSGTITMTAGQKCAIRMEYYENTGGAVAKLSWSYPGQTRQIIPKQRLYLP